MVSVNNYESLEKRLFLLVKNLENRNIPMVIKYMWYIQFDQDKLPSTDHIEKLIIYSLNLLWDTIGDLNVLTKPTDLSISTIKLSCDQITSDINTRNMKF